MQNIVYNDCVYLRPILANMDERKCHECTDLTDKLNKAEGDTTHGKFCDCHYLELRAFLNTHICKENCSGYGAKDRKDS